MKRIFIAFICMFFFACSKSKSPGQMAKEVCDCFTKNQHISLPNPETWESYDECTRMQVEVWKKFKDNSDKRQLYNDVLRDCTNELLKKAGLEPL